MNEDSPETVTKAGADLLNRQAKAFRDQRRTAAAFEEVGDKSAAALAIQKANELWAELQGSLVKPITRHARAQFGSEKNELFFDFVSELHYVIYRELTNLSESKDIWEQRFNLLLERQAIKLAPRLKRRYGATDISLDEPVGLEDAGEGESKRDRIEDESESLTHFWVEFRDVLRWIEKEQGPQHLEVFKLRFLEELKWDDIAVHCEISEKTARTHYQKTLELLKGMNL